ncbi:Glycoside hydrolase 2 (Mannanase, beta-galactosidase) [Cichlidogyrus casuarinus]|uniref:Glycoside hydrolase 2 (Mannanase, beta-galactosidase) n=1 Tax=Cichlidogyrus casuarinus TaxID=1844966 RepID=A0ABD2PZD6_9PLAT
MSRTIIAKSVMTYLDSCFYCFLRRSLISVAGPEDVNAGWNGDSVLCFLSHKDYSRGKKLSNEDGEKEVSSGYPSWTRDWRIQEARDMIRNCFTAGEWTAKEDAATLLKADAMARDVLASMQMEKTKKENLEALVAKKGKSTKLRGIEFEQHEDKEDYSEDDEDTDKDVSSGEDPDDDQVFSLDENSEKEDAASGSDEEQEEEEEEEDPDAEFEKKLLRPTKRQKLLEKRKKHRLLFENLLDQAQGGSKMEGGQAATAEFDKMMSRHEAQMAKNREVLDSLPEETRLALEGHPPGSYVKLKIEGVPHEFITNLDPRKPLVVGGLARCEESMGFLHARFLTHRWSHRILKSNDPITLSVGWRRYQTVAVFSKEEHNLRKRYLKYSLKHEHCHMTFFGPLCPPKTGLIAFLNSAWRPNESDSKNFRVAGTGVVLDLNNSFMVMKKLKLIGEPSKIFAKTAFITGMFNSPLEVSKVIGAKIQTVSKIRGIIKASLKNEHNSKPGDFRATFEAPIKRADLVFLRSFVKVDLPQYYNPVMNLLCPLGAFAGDANNAEPGAWRMMRTTAEMRRDMGGLKPDNKSDSHYRKIERLPYVPKELQIPVKLAAQLPYKEKPKMSKFEYRKAIRSKIGHDPLLTNSDIPEEVVPLTVKMDLGEDSAQAPQLKVQEKATRREMLSRLMEIHADYKARQKMSKKKRTAEFIKKKEEETQKLEQQRKLKRKEFFRKGGGKTPATKRQKVK